MTRVTRNRSGRKRLFSYGPTVSYGMQSVGSTYQPSRRGVFMRVPPATALGHSLTVKSRLSRKVVKGTEPYGQQPYNYPSPQV